MPIIDKSEIGYFDAPSHNNDDAIRYEAVLYRKALQSGLYYPKEPIPHIEELLV